MQHSPVLSHIPPHLKLMISESVDWQTQFQLRRCSKKFRDVVDASATQFPSINITFYKNKVKIMLGGNVFYYQSHDEGYMIRRTRNLGGNRVVKGKGNFIDRTVRFVESIFKNSRKSVWRFQFDFAHRMTSIETYNQMKEEFTDKMSRLMAKTPYLLSINVLALRMKMDDQDVLKFLQYCQPGTLEHIHLIHRISKPDTISDNFLVEAAESEQWRMAKKLSQIDFTLTLPYEKWAHLEFVFLVVKTLPLQSLTSLIHNFQLKPEWTDHEKGNREVVNYFKALPKFDPDMRERRIDIPGCESHVIVFEYQGRRITMKKLDLEVDDSDDSDNDDEQ